MPSMSMYIGSPFGAPRVPLGNAEQGFESDGFTASPCWRSHADD